MAVVLVTGSSGLIGRAVVRSLARSFQVVGFDREGWPHPPREAECVCVDLTSNESVAAGIERVRYAYGSRIASVVHLAAYYDFSGEPSPMYDEITVRGTGRLLRALQALDVEQLVFSSTMLVHAPSQPGERINEDWPLEPKWDYPRSKVATEALIRRERGDIRAVSLRIAGVYDDECDSIPLANQIQRIFERKLTGRLFPGDISRGQSFVHLADVTEAFVKTVERRHQLDPDETLLIGEPDTLSYDELQRAFARLIHDEVWETRSIPKMLAKAGAWLEDSVPGEEPFIKPWMIDLADDHYALDIGRARKTLGWEPKRSLRETLPRMVSALKADPLSFYKKNKLEVPSWLEQSVTPAAMSPPSGERSDSGQSAPAQAAGGLYTCPMHPEVRQDRPGTCPKCGMRLVRQQPREPQHGEQHAPDHLEMVRQMRESWLWTNATVALLGVWLISSPFTFGYTRSALLWSDVVSGMLLALFSVLASWPAWDFVGRWTVAFVGIWLQVAPLVFWAPDATVYLNDTLVGALAITLSILVPMMPGMAHHMEMMKPGPEIASGWSYNPSTWHQRAPMIVLGFAGWLISRYLAAFQLGYIESVWDPFFGEGTQRVLTSDVSRMFPISDAGLGAFAYTAEFLMAWMGGRTRWRSMPWMVTFFFIVVVPLGLTHIILVILQPLAVGAWCTLCLAAAFLMLVMIPFTVDEVIVTGQFLRAARRDGQSLWRTFWAGGTIPGGSDDRRTPRYGAPSARMWAPVAWGVSVPWTLGASALVGVSVMFGPALFGTAVPAAHSDQVTGALVVTIAVMATAEVVRSVRFLNVLLGAWIAVSGWMLGGATVAGHWSGIVAGLLIVALALPRGPIRERYGAWQRWIF